MFNETVFKMTELYKGWEIGKLSEVGQKVQISRYKISSVDMMYMVTTVKNSVLQIRKLPREEILKVTTIKKKNLLTMYGVKPKNYRIMEF